MERKSRALEEPPPARQPFLLGRPSAPSHSTPIPAPAHGGNTAGKGGSSFAFPTSNQEVVVWVEVTWLLDAAAEDGTIFTLRTRHISPSDESVNVGCGFSPFSS